MGDMQGLDMADECGAACAEKREVRCATNGLQTAVDIRAEKSRTTTRGCDGARGHAARAAAWGHFSGTEFADRCGAPGSDTANGRANALAAIVLLVLFALWTWAVSTVDVRPIGPGGSRVGLASLNEAFHRWTGVHMGLYLATDWLSLVPVGCVLGFGALGLVQLVRRRSLLRVDRDLLMLGVFYVVLLGAYLFFEEHIVNWRPVLIEGVLEASYPSSTTLLVTCVMSTTFMQVTRRVRPCVARRVVQISVAMFALLMVGARMVCGVHWLSDVVGGLLLSAALVLAYRAAAFSRPARHRA